MKNKKSQEMIFKVFTIIAIILVIVIFLIFIYGVRTKVKIRVMEKSANYNLEVSLYALLMTPYHNHYVYDYLILMYYKSNDQERLERITKEYYINITEDDVKKLNDFVDHVLRELYHAGCYRIYINGDKIIEKEPCIREGNKISVEDTLLDFGDSVGNSEQHRIKIKLVIWTKDKIID